MKQFIQRPGPTWPNAPDDYDASRMILSSGTSSNFWNDLKILVTQPVGLSTL